MAGAAGAHFVAVAQGARRAGGPSQGAGRSGDGAERGAGAGTGVRDRPARVGRGGGAVEGVREGGQAEGAAVAGGRVGRVRGGVVPAGVADRAVRLRGCGVRASAIPRSRVARFRSGPPGNVDDRFGAVGWAHLPRALARGGSSGARAAWSSGSWPQPQGTSFSAMAGGCCPHSSSLRRFGPGVAPWCARRPGCDCARRSGRR